MDGVLKCKMRARTARGLLPYLASYLLEKGDATDIRLKHLASLMDAYMTSDEFLGNFAEILEVPVDTISLQTSLDSLDNWDSINVLTYMMMVDEKLSRQVDPDAVANSQTVSDLFKLATQ